MNGTRRFHIKRRYKVLGILLGVLLGIPLLCIGVFVFGAYYGQWRMDTARAEMFELAGMLGYEPAAHLYDSVQVSNVSIVGGSRRCAATLLYTTQMNKAEFEQQLQQLPWSRVEHTGQYNDWYSLYASLGLTIGGLRYDDRPYEYNGMFMGKYHRSWGLEGKSVRIHFYNVPSLGFPLEYEGQPFTQSVVYISVSRGVFPIWLNCPTQFNREPSVSS